MNPTTAFFQALYSGYPTDPDLRIELRPILPKRFGGKPGPRRFHPLDCIPQAASDALLAGRRHESYMGVLPRAGEGGTQDHVLHAQVLWADVDGGEGGARAAASLIKGIWIPWPNAIICSGNGLHCYWWLSECIELPTKESKDQFNQVLRRLARAIGSRDGAHADVGVCQCASTLRVPGTLNHKSDPPKDVELLLLDTESVRSSYDWWRAELPAIPLTCAPYRPPTTPLDRPPRWVEEWKHQPAPDGERHGELVRVAAKLKRDYGLSEDQILPVLREKAAISGSGHTEERIQEIVRWA